MTELQLFRFISDNKIEWHWQDNDGTQDVICFLHFAALSDFCTLIDNYGFEYPWYCVLKPDSLAIWMGDICEYYGIELESVFDKD